MKLRDFLNLDYERIMFFSETEYKERIKDLNIISVEEIDNIQKIEYTNNSGKRFILKVENEIYILKENILNDDIGNFVTYADNLQHFETICQTKEEALEKLKKHDDKYKNQENARKIYKELEAFYGKEYTKDIEQEILSLFNKYSCTVLQIETKINQNKKDVDKIFYFKTNDNFTNESYSILVALTNNVIIDF